MEQFLNEKEATVVVVKARADSAICTQLEAMARALSSDANAYDRHKAEEAAIRLG